MDSVAVNAQLPSFIANTELFVGAALRAARILGETNNNGRVLDPPLQLAVK